jgi:uncharacterized membrane protein YjgN (DUF898 family)
METIEAAAPAAVQSPGAPAVQRLQFEFRGSAAEYFRIWIVNLALTLVTLGIYSAWAKVRRLRYLHGQTVLAGSGFGYHGEPLRILKGRLIAFGLFIVYLVAGQLDPVAGLVAGLLLGAAIPWLVVKSLRFRFRMTSWRGLRFDFRQDFARAYLVYFGWGILSVVTLGLALPQFVRKLHQFAVGHASYGSTRFECTPPLAPFYWAALKALGFLVGAMLAVLAIVTLLAYVFGSGGGEPGVALSLLPAVSILLAYVVAVGVFQAGTLNAVYGNTSLGPNRLHSDLNGPRLAWLYLGNTLAIIASLGLLVPWATVRLLRYRLATLQVEATGSIDDFVAAQQAGIPGAAGEEIAEVFDVDFGL